VIFAAIFLRELLNGSVFLFCRVDQLVLDVGDVDDPGDLVSLEHEISLDRVKDDRADHVPDVRRFVDRRAAQIDSDLSRANRFEHFLLLGQRVVNAKAHENFLRRER
jgi:hypothetical protein